MGGDFWKVDCEYNRYGYIPKVTPKIFKDLKYKLVTFSPKLVQDLQLLEKKDKRLKRILTDTQKFRRADKIAKAREERKLKQKKS